MIIKNYMMILRVKLMESDKYNSLTDVPADVS